MSRGVFHIMRVEMFTSAHFGVLIKKQSLVTCLHKQIKLWDIFNDQKKENKKQQFYQMVHEILNIQYLVCGISRLPERTIRGLLKWEISIWKPFSYCIPNQTRKLFELLIAINCGFCTFAYYHINWLCDFGRVKTKQHIRSDWACFLCLVLKYNHVKF